MCRTQQVLALIMLFVGLAYSFSWDIVVGGQNKLEFYNNGAIVHVEDFGSDLYIEHLAYDVAHNRLLLVDGNWTRDTFIYSFNIETKEKQSVVKRNFNGTFHVSMYSLAYDPVTEILFWTNRFTMYWFSLKPGFVNNVYGNVLFESDDSLPWAVAVDSCKGYIYWSNVIDGGFSAIKKARLDGSEKELVLRGNKRAVENLVIDQQTQKMYWTDEKIEQYSPDYKPQFSLHSAGLNGENRTTLYIEKDKHQPQALAVSKDSIYWVPALDLSSKIWHLPKNPSEDTKPEAISVSGWNSNSIATNYKIEDQIQGIEDCEPLRGLLAKHKVTNE